MKAHSLAFGNLDTNRKHFSACRDKHKLEETLFVSLGNPSKSLSFSTLPPSTGLHPAIWLYLHQELPLDFEWIHLAQEICPLDHQDGPYFSQDKSDQKSANSSFARCRCLQIDWQHLLEHSDRLVCQLSAGSHQGHNWLDLRKIWESLFSHKRVLLESYHKLVPACFTVIHFLQTR